MNTFMDDRMRLMRSVNHALVPAGAVLLTALGWVLLRLPRGNLMLATGALLTAGLVYDIRGFHRRLFAVFWIFLLAAGLQFLFSALAHRKILLLILPSIYSYTVLRLFPNKRGACMALILGHLALGAAPGWYAGMSRAFDFLIPFAAVLACTAFIPLIHSPDHWIGAAVKVFTPRSAFRITLLLAIGTYLMQALPMPEGIWIPLTIAFLYCRDVENDPEELIFDRIAGTMAGLLLGWIFLGTFTFLNYKTAYLLIGVIALACFLLYRTESYFLYTLFFMAAFCLYADLSAPDGHALYFRQLFLSRTIATALGAFLVVLFEAFFFPDKRKRREVPA